MRGVELDDGTVLEAPLVVSACDPRETFVRWLRDPPAAAGPLVERWRAKPVDEGYESKIDAVITRAAALPIPERAPLRAAGHSGADRRHDDRVAHARRHRRRAPSDRSGLGGREADVLREHPVRARPVHARRWRQARPQRRDPLHAVLTRRRLGGLGRAAALAACARLPASATTSSRASSGGA